MKNLSSSKSHPSNGRFYDEKSIGIRISSLERSILGWKIHLHPNLIARTVDFTMKNPSSSESHPSNGRFFDEKSIFIQISSLERSILGCKIHFHPNLIPRTVNFRKKNRSASESHPSNGRFQDEKSIFIQISSLERSILGWKIHLHPNLIPRMVDFRLKNPSSSESHPTNGRFLDEKSIFIRI